MQHKHDGRQDLMHALPVAKVRLLLAVDEQDVQHGLPDRKDEGKEKEYVHEIIRGMEGT